MYKINIKNLSDAAFVKEYSPLAAMNDLLHEEVKVLQNEIRMVYIVAKNFASNPQIKCTQAVYKIIYLRDMFASYFERDVGIFLPYFAKKRRH